MAAKKAGQSKGKASKATRQWEAVGPAVDLDLIKALGHGLRIAILTVLNDRMASPNELSKELGEGLSQVSYHVKVLKDYNMIEMVKTEPRRGAVEHYYRARTEVFIPAWQMQLLPKSAQRAAYSGVLAEFEEDLAISLETGTFDNRDDWVVARDPRILDDQGRIDAEKAVAKFLRAYKAIGAKAAKRIAKGESEAIPTTAAVLVFGTARSKSKKRGSR